MNRTGVWFSGHMAGNAGFFLGVPLAGPFFVGRVGGGVGGGSLGSSEGILVVILPSVGIEGMVVLPWRACINWFQARWDRDHILFTVKEIDC